MHNYMRMDREIPSLFDRGGPGPRGGPGRNSRNIRGMLKQLVLNMIFNEKINI